MSNKLVYIDQIPFWMTPEGSFKKAELDNGHVVERIMLRTSLGLQSIGSTVSLQD